MNTLFILLALIVLYLLWCHKETVDEMDETNERLDALEKRKSGTMTKEEAIERKGE